MGITQKSRWDDTGTEPGAGDAKYVASQQPIAEYDNWANKALVDDVGALNARMFDAIYPEQQTTPGMTLKINSGKVYFGETLLSYAGGNTPSFTAPTSNPRIDIVTLDSAGTLAITQGAEGASPSPPAYPNDKIVICEAYNRVGETSIKTVSDGTNGYIYKDVRPYVRSNPSQAGVQADATEAQTWDAGLTNLKNNLNRIRNQIVAITGEAWGTVSRSIVSIWSKFNASTGHKHTGSADDAPKIGVSGLDFTPSTYSSGNYTGNNTENRAIAHGMGSTPKLILITEKDSNVSNLSGWTETDPNGKLSVTSSRVTFTGLAHNGTNTLISIAAPAALDGDFKIDFEYQLNSSDGGNYGPGIGVSNSVSQRYKESGTTAIVLSNNGGSLVLYKFTDGTTTHTSAAYGSFSTGVLYYCTMERVGATITVSLYTNAARTTLVDTAITITEGSIGSYSYICAGWNSNEANGTVESGYFQNIWKYATGSLFRIIDPLPTIYCEKVAGGLDLHSVTAPTSTNFYVGNAKNYTKSANASGKTYYYMAFG